MMKKLLTLASIISITLFLTGCYGEYSDEISPEHVALREVEKITTQQGYSIESPEGKEVLIDDSDTFQSIKDVSIEEGYLEDDFTSMTEDRKIISYSLKEKSKEKEPIDLNIVVDRDKAIGAYLNYYEYRPDIKPISFKEFSKE